MASEYDKCGEFVVVDELQTLRDVQNTLMEELLGIKAQVAGFAENARLLRQTREDMAKVWQTLASFVVLVIPVVAAIIVESASIGAPSPAMAMTTSLAGVLLSFSICVGVPIFVLSFVEAKSVIEEIGCPLFGKDTSVKNEEEEEEEEQVEEENEEEEVATDADDENEAEAVEDSESESDSDHLVSGQGDSTEVVSPVA